MNDYMHVTILNHIAFGIIFVGILFWFIYDEIKENKELEFDEVFLIIILGSVVAGLTSYFWFIVFPFIGFICGLWGLVLILKKLAKALILVNAQKADKKLEKYNE